MADTAPAPSPYLAQALAYLERGWPVFPVCRPIREGRCVQHGECSNAGKRPLVRWEAYQTRLPTEAEVTAWWTRDRTANIGMATGALSGIVVLDCDGSEARKAALDQGVPPTPAVFTGKPGGIHYHLSHPGFAVQNFARKGAAGLDFRGDGGYVLLPSSHHARGADYRWVDGTEGQPLAVPPDWLLDLIHAPRVASDPDAAHTGLDLDLVLAGIPAGQRDETLWRYACRLRSENVPLAFAELFVRQAARACQPPFDEDSAAEKVQRAYREYAPTLTLEVPSVVTAPVPMEPELPSPFLRPISDLLAQPEVPVDWLVTDLFSVGSSGWVGAEPKVGKSWLTLELIYCLSTGTPFLDRFAISQPRRVVYIQEEDSEQRVLRRFKQLLRGTPGRTAPPDDYLRFSVRQGFKIDSPLWIMRLRAELQAWPADVCVFDVFQRLHLKSENAQDQMAAVLAELDALNREFGCAFIVVHHNRKPQQGNEARGNQMLRGSGVLAGWAECSLYLKGGQAPGSILVTPESKDAAAMDDFQVTIADQPNGGVRLVHSSAQGTAQQAAENKAVLDAIRELAHARVDCTREKIAERLGLTPSKAYRILKRLVALGAADEDRAIFGQSVTNLYTVADGEHE